MFVKTIKLKKTAKILAYVLCILIAALCVVFVFNRLFAPKGISLGTTQEQIEFLEGLGWETSPEPIDCRSVIIPQEWSDVYTQYNELQLQQGFDLDKYRGEYAEIYTYEIYNYGDSRQNIVANLIICAGKLIAGDVCCTELGGFMQGLVKSDA